MRAGRASATAQRVAAQRLTFERVVADGGDPSSDDLLARDVAGGVAVSPGVPMSRYLAGRTSFFDRVVVRSLDVGVRQVVVAAAGYDGRSLRYARPGVHWFEVDHPDTQADKRARLRRLGIATDAVAFVPADFAVDDVAGALATAGHDATRPSLFLCEGIAVYLDDDVLRSLLRRLRDRAAAGSRLAISLSVDAGLPGLEERRRRFEAAVAALGEPARSTITIDGAADLLAAAGWEEVGPVAGSDRATRARVAGFAVLRPADRPAPRPQA